MIGNAGCIVVLIAAHRHYEERPFLCQAPHYGAMATMANHGDGVAHDDAVRGALHEPHIIRNDKVLSCERGA